jgi:hypothetical protein
MKIGITENSRVRIVSKCRIRFDRRVTEIVDDTRDMFNHKAAQEPLRKRQWELRQAARANA